MLNGFSHIHWTSLFVIVQSCLVAWIVLKIICRSNQQFLSFLYISSGKSSTNARLLGGLAISASLASTISSFLFFNTQILSKIESLTLISALVSILLVTIYGYVDDKFEVRVRFKLTLQVASISSFAYFNAYNISPSHPVLGFFASTILGLALLNGTNLLDGLDTLSVKLGLVSSLAFLYLGIIANSPATILLSVILISALSVFYFFNREPAKIYMGEIGGSIIGLTYYFQSSMCFSELKTHMGIPQALALVLIACSFPIIELAISFMRRVISRRTPFRGDRLHLHYIIKNKYKLSANSTSNRMGALGAFIVAAGFLLASTIGSIPALVLTTAFTLHIYLWICLNEWRSHYANRNHEHVFKIFEGKKVNVINSGHFNTLDISVKAVSKKKKSA